MTRDDVIEALEIIGWSTIRLSRRSAIHLRQVSKWVTGYERVPAEVAAWLIGLRDYHLAHPSPAEIKERHRGHRRLPPVVSEPAAFPPPTRRGRVPGQAVASPMPVTRLVPPPVPPFIDPRDDVQATIRRLQQLAAERIADRERGRR
jgi:hypothetical protein